MSNNTKRVPVNNLWQKDKLYPNSSKQLIIWDVDDVVWSAAEVCVDIINERFILPYQTPKSVNDIKDWGFKSIYRDITQKDIEDIFASDEFFNRVQLKEGFVTALKSGLLSKYNNVFVTKGSKENLIKKEKCLQRMLGGDFEMFEFVGLSMEENKSDINMIGGIIIDDNVNYLKNTNAYLKILLKNDRETQYNNLSDKEQCSIENLYIVNNWDELIQVLEFNSTYKI